MRRIVLIMILIMIFSLIGVSSSVFAIDNSLKGIKSVYVLVSHIEPELVQAGLTLDQIHTDVELKLRLAGIKVLNKGLKKALEETNKPLTITEPFLDIKVASFEEEREGIFIYNIKYELHQEVSLTRNPSIKVTVSTWDDNIVAIGEVNKIREEIKGLVDNFLFAYLSVNSKKQVH